MSFKFQVPGFRLKRALHSGSKFAGFFALLLLSFGTASAQKEYSIAQIQGDKNISPVDGQNVRASGIVTARTRSGFFIQTPDDRIDGDPNTSDGIFVFTKTEPPVEATVGNLVTVTGTVEEFRLRNDASALTLTEITMQKDRDMIAVISKNSPLPKAPALSLNDFKPNAIDQLERYEGMRVFISELTVIAPTDGRVDGRNGSSVSNGTFFGVLKGIAKPFREPGLEIFDYVFLSEKDKEALRKNFPKLPLFDANPERLRIESSAQLGASPLDVSAYSEIKNIAGVLHYTSRAYTLFVDVNSKPAVSNSVKPTPLAAPNAQQFSVVGMNLENFFDDVDDPAIREDIVTAEAFARRLGKISAGVRSFMHMPDVIGIIEAENLPALKRLADKINADAVAAGKPDPKYEAFLQDGNDGRGIDNGFLVKTSRVKVNEVRQLGKDDKYKNPNTGEDNFVNDRPSLMLRASINDPKSGKPFEFTVIVNHLKSYLGYNDPRQQDNVRLKKKLQAESLAKFVQERQKADPKERIILLGDFNSYQFSDGVLDMIGTIKGKPAAKDEVLNASGDLVDPDLIDLVDVIDAKQRYSYTYDGNGQVLDHIIISETLRNHINGFGFARLNADFPEIFRSDASRPERFSDHDPAIAYFTFDDVTAAGTR